MEKKNILVVDDDKDILELLEYNLNNEGYKVLKAKSGEMAIEIIKKNKPDLIILDLMLPDIDGIQICKILKKDRETESIPIIMLTAKGEESDIILGLELGAEDYIVKPFSPKLLIARVKTVLRRYMEKPASFIKLGNLCIDYLNHEVTLNGEPIHLSKIEFNLLSFLAKYPGQVFSRERLLDRVWGENTYSVDRTVDVHIRRLRKKLKAFSKYIVTVRGIGYKFVPY